MSLTRWRQDATDSRTFRGSKGHELQVVRVGSVETEWEQGTETGGRFQIDMFSRGSFVSFLDALYSNNICIYTYI